MSAITFGGRAFKVTKDGDQYVLAGTRGARYRTLRCGGARHLFYLSNDRDWTKSAPGVRLTDENGTLEVA